MQGGRWITGSAWSVVFGANLIVPLNYAQDSTQRTGRIGLLLEVVRSNLDADAPRGGVGHLLSLWPRTLTRLSRTTRAR